MSKLLASILVFIVASLTFTTLTHHHAHATAAPITDTVVAPVAAPVAAVQPIDRTSYITSVRNTVPSVANATDANLLGIGNNVCDDLTADGASNGVFTSIAETLFGAGMTSNDAGNIIGAAVGYLCPQFDDAALAFAAN